MKPNQKTAVELLMFIFSIVWLFIPIGCYFVYLMITNNYDNEIFQIWSGILSIAPLTIYLASLIVRAIYHLIKLAIHGE